MERINEKVAENLFAEFGRDLFEVNEFRGELTVIVPPDRIVEVCTFLKDDPDLCYNVLADLCGIDMYTPSKRFGIIYNLFSLSRNHRLRLKTFVHEEDPRISTVSGVWSTANWHEREAYDMYGILFDGHPDLRRMYMPDDFEYYPLRKDFPLMGIPGSLQLPKK